MKLREALELIQQRQLAGVEPERYWLGCSSTPAHLQTFLRAFLMTGRPHSDVQVESSLFGDLLGSIERFPPAGYAGVAVVCEWYDLDPRLGFRRLGGWTRAGLTICWRTSRRRSRACNMPWNEFPARFPWRWRCQRSPCLPWKSRLRRRP